MRKLLILPFILSICGCGTMNFMSAPPPVYIVFFPAHSTDITKLGHDIVDHAAAGAKVQPGKMVQLTGPSTQIAPGYDPSLAEPRIHAVEQALIADGVSADHLVRASEITDGVNLKSDPSGAQRVEIRLVDKTGAGS